MLEYFFDLGCSMGTLQEIYKEYMSKPYPSNDRVDLDAIGQLILSIAENNNGGFEQCASCVDANNQKHDYSYFVMDDDYRKEVPKNWDTYDFFKHRYVLRGQSHSVVASYLEKYQDSKFRAVTSLCYGNGSYFFHSYILDNESNCILDFSRNIIMPKEQYDELFVCEEINSLSYGEYVFFLRYYEYMLCGEDYCRLMFLALIKLYEDEKNANLPEGEYPAEYVGSVDFKGIPGRTFNRH